MPETMTDTTTDMPYTIRLAALDRAINFLQHSHRTDAASADEVVASAARFEKYLGDGS
jgi:hypothetical protein